jgi:hypothetical protein
MWLWRHWRRYFLFMIWVGCLTPLAAGLKWLGEHPELVPSLLVSVIGFAFLFFCAGSFYVLMDTGFHLDEDLTLSFWEALKRSYRDFKNLLSFVPIIGPLFEPDEDRTHHDRDDK